MIENVHRDDLTYLEEAEQLRELMELESFTVAQLAEAVGQSVPHVKGRLSLLSLPDKARTALDAGVITYGTALALTEIADYPDVIDELIDEQDGVDAEQVQEAIRQVGIDRDCDRLRQEATARGWRLIEGCEPRSLGYVYVAELDTLTTRQQQAHARQSCHAVYLDVTLGRARLTGLCSTPARHRPTPTPKRSPGDDTVQGTPPESDSSTEQSVGDDEVKGVEPEARVKSEAAWQAQREEREHREREETKNRKRVATARREFLAGLIGKRTPKRAEVVAYIFGAVLEKASQTTMGWVGKILGLDPVTSPFGATNWHTPVAGYAAQSGDQMLKVVLLVTSHWAEEHVTQYASGYDAALVRHLELLGALGYVPDPYESEQIASYRQNSQASHPTTDHAAEDGNERASGDMGDDPELPGEVDVQDAGEAPGEIESPKTRPEKEDANTVSAKS